MNIKYYAAAESLRVTHVIQGEYCVSSDPNEILTTFLGSCVATCLCDPVSKVGGLNHFLLPNGDDRGGKSFRYGLHSMELLINGLLKLGARKSRLEAKLFGGAMMHDGLGRIGVANGQFATQFLRSENIRCISSSLGGTQARRIKFVPTTGKARQMLLPHEALIEDHRPSMPDDDVVIF